MTKSTHERSGTRRLTVHERRAAYAVSLYGALLALWWLYLAANDSGEVSTSVVSPTFGRCLAPFVLVGRTCQAQFRTTPEHLYITSIVLLIIVVAVGLLARRGSFTGTFVMAIIGGFAIGWWPTGVPFLVLAVGLLVIQLRAIAASLSP